jgi:hypothetical protein
MVHGIIHSPKLPDQLSNVLSCDPVGLWAGFNVYVLTSSVCNTYLTNLTGSLLILWMWTTVQIKIIRFAYLLLFSISLSMNILSTLSVNVDLKDLGQPWFAIVWARSLWLWINKSNKWENYYKFQFICNTPSFLKRTEIPKWTERFSKALLSSVFGRFCWTFIVFFFEMKLFCVLKNLSALFGCAKKHFCSFRMDQFFPFVANELKFAVLILDFVLKFPQ